MRLFAFTVASLLVFTHAGRAEAPPPAPSPPVAPSIVVVKPWSKVTPPGARVAAGFLTVKNNGKGADRLLAASTPAAARVELHVMSMKDGIMSMREVKDGLPIAAGASLVLEPGGTHLMLIGPTSPFVVGTPVPVTLTFEKAGAITTAFAVVPLDATGPDDTHAAAVPPAPTPARVTK